MKYYINKKYCSTQSYEQWQNVSQIYAEEIRLKTNKTILCMKNQNKVLFYISSKLTKLFERIYSMKIYKWISAIEKITKGVPGWLSRLSIQLWLRSWSHGPWVGAPRRALCWQLGAWSLLQILCFPLSLTLPCLHMHSLSLSLSLSKINKH